MESSTRSAKRSISSAMKARLLRFSRPAGLRFGPPFASLLTSRLETRSPPDHEIQRPDSDKVVPMSLPSSSISLSVQASSPPHTTLPLLAASEELPAISSSVSSDPIDIIRLAPRPELSSDPPIAWLIILPGRNELMDTSAVAATNQSSVSRLTHLPHELFNMIFRDLTTLDRYCLAMTCKAAMRFAWSNPSFLDASSELSLGLLSPRPAVLFRRNLNFGLGKSALRETSKYRELLRLMSKGWVRKDLHYCDICKTFRELGDDMIRVRGEWYGDM